MVMKLQGLPPDDLTEHSQALQALIYRWIDSVDPEKAAQLHDGADGIDGKRSMKPFSIAPLKAVGDKRLALSITSLDDDLARLICAGALLYNQPVRLKAKSTHHSYSLDPQIEHEVHCDWTDFLANAVPATAWKVTLVSPTACKIKGRINPAPLPSNYFASWFRRWESFSTKALPQLDILDFVEARVDVAALQGATKGVPIAPQEKPYPGFYGAVLFSVHKPTAKDRAYLEALDTLVAFAEFAGTGAQTMRGMGLTRTTRLKTWKA
jgi:CRISPR-associated endoribonuclease Cas6